MTIKIPHTCSKVEAKERVEKLLDRLTKEHVSQVRDLKEEWTDFTCRLKGSAKGYSVSGSIEIEDNIVAIDLKIPLLLQVFSNKIRSLVEEQVGNSLFEDCGKKSG